MSFVKKIFFFFFIVYTSSSLAQIIDPVKWEYAASKVSATEYDLVFTASISPKWAIYSQFLEEGGPLPTVFTFEDSDNYKRIGGVQESKINRVTQYDLVFQMDVTKFYDIAKFTQRVEVVKSNFVITGNIDYMTCDDKQCTIKPDNPFQFKYNADTGIQFVTPLATDIIVEPNNTALLSLYGLSTSTIGKATSNCGGASNFSTASIGAANQSLWYIFAMGLVGGFIALLTPCVFPMIPLTVSFFTKKESSQPNKGVFNAIMYGVFIVFVYVIFSTPFHLMTSLNPDILNEISTNVWLNVSFFLVFLFFAFSFFGFYDLTLPASWTNSTAKGENSGGLIGIFFMALTLAIVSFSCTGPILGSLLAGSLSADGGAWQLTVGMAGFGVALGLPFAIFALFPNMLGALPKSGGWLNTIKVVLGFLELALAFKFLSNADLVEHWGVLKIEAFLGIWIFIFIGLALYLWGKIKFPHDAPIQKLSILRLGSGVGVFLFVIYLGYGLRVNKETTTYDSLQLLSGLAPPVGYSFFYPQDCPNGFVCFKDFKEGVSYAKRNNKPILLDFTGYACVNCRKMEEQIWPLPQVQKYINEEYVLISLYVDDKKPLPKSEKVEVNRIAGGTRTLENFGHKWAHFQTTYFNANSQPYYALLTPDGQTLLNQPIGYTPSEEEYSSFLQCGLEVFQSISTNSFK
jgi:thiol:disulfide interchange protein DsbD